MLLTGSFPINIGARRPKGLMLRMFEYTSIVVVPGARLSAHKANQMDCFWPRRLVFFIPFWRHNILFWPLPFGSSIDLQPLFDIKSPFYLMNHEHMQIV